MRNTWEFFSSENIVFGNGAIQKLDKVLSRFGAKNVLLVTDQGIKSAGILEKVTDELEKYGYHYLVYDKAVPEPPIKSAMECLAYAQSEMQTDVIIGLGGGSSIDLAKVVGLLLEYGGEPRDYFGGENLVPGPVKPMIAIPTTAGTGSEVTSVTVLTDTENQMKVGISDNFLRPSVALLDPELTVGLPPYVTACSGIDALSHAIEAYTAKDYKYIEAEGNLLFQGSNPISDVYAIKAIQLIADNLIVAVHQGSNVKARENMLLASLFAGMAFSNAGTAAAHALAYPIGGVTKSPHGEVTGLLLPYVMKHNATVAPEKMAEIAKAFHYDLSGLNNHEAAELGYEAVLNLLGQINLPQTLSEIGVQEEQIPEIASKALQIDRLIRNNPRVPSQNSFEELLETAFA